MNTTANLALYSALVGSVLPLVIAVVQREKWSSQTRSLVAFAACVATGLGTAYFDGDLTAKTAVAAVLTVLIAAKTTYGAIWQPTGVVPKIEAGTTPAATP